MLQRSRRPESSLDRHRQHTLVYHFCQVRASSVVYDLLEWLTRGLHMDVCLVIQQRLKELGLEQQDLADAAQVTESYISQLLSRKKAPPAANRTDIYEKMTAFLRLPKGSLAAMVEAQRQEEWRRRLADPPKPLYHEVREVVIRKCQRERQKQVRDIFERQAFGELERLVTQKLLDVTKRIARDELENERWLRSVAKLRNQSYEEARTIILDFLDTDLFNISIAHCTTFLIPMIESWNIDMTTFAMKVLLNPLLSPVRLVYVEFTERDEVDQVEPGFEEFLGMPELRGDATPEELELLRNLKFRSRRPTAMFYYQELRNLRDPLHFRDGSRIRLHKRGDANSAERQKQLDSRKKAIRRWTKNQSNFRKKNKKNN
jgi:transcriptional regulator with XRE-family HTH domain